MKRREFLGVLGGAAVWPATVRAQPTAPKPRIGVLMGVRGGDTEGRRWANRFIQTLRELGWRNGNNVDMEMKWTLEPDQMRIYAQELIDQKPNVIHVTTAIATAEVLRKTSTIPVVFSMVNDPVALGFVKKLDKPGGNATGFINVDPAMAQHWVTQLKELSPNISRVAVLYNPIPGSVVELRWKEFETAAASLGLKIESAPVRNVGEMERVADALAKDSTVGVLILPDVFFNMARSPIVVSILNRRRIVTLYPFRDFVQGGGLASYSVNFPDLERRSAEYVDRILKGAAPADLPVQAPTKFESVINLRTAKEIGLSIPQAVRSRASEVLE
jgi:putative ABC transport system substrate-binding protein